MSPTDAALDVAYARSREVDSCCPLFVDPHAQQFLDAAAERGWQPPSVRMAERVASISDYAACRTKWFDEFFVAAGSNGVEQAVILAAGLDARAWRLPWTSGSTVFEIDQPLVLTFKADVLRRHGVEPAARYVPVAADLRDDWPSALRHNGFDPNEPTAWSAEGLLPYLPAAGHDLLFERVLELSAPGSRFAVEAIEPAEDRTDVADWLAGRGWQTMVTSAPDLIRRYHRDLPESVPRTEFVSAQLLS